MKTLALVLAFLGSILFVKAGNSTQEYIPQEIESAFHHKFPDVQKVVWSHLSNGNYEADFSFAHKRVNVYFDVHGHLLESDVELKWLDIPAHGRQYVYSNFALCHIVKLEVIERPKKENRYGVYLNRNNKNYLLEFNGHGDLLRRRILD